MKIDKISIAPLLPIGSFLNIRVGIEATLEKHENLEEALTEANKRISDWHRKEFPHIYASGFENVPQGEEIPIKKIDKLSDEMKSTIDDIMQCADEETLKTFWLQSKSNLILKEAYNRRQKQLQDAGTKK